MQIVEPTIEIARLFPTEIAMNHLERCGRICYQSDPKGDPDNFIKKRIQQEHESVIEHVSVTAFIQCDRGVLAEVTRHRLASYSVESTRYCNYGSDKFGGEIKIIDPIFSGDNQEELFLTLKEACEVAEKYYNKMLELGATPQEARGVLPTNLKTMIAMTCNLREWRHFFKMRCDLAAHPHAQKVADMLLDEMYDYLPAVFEDIYQWRNELKAFKK